MNEEEGMNEWMEREGVREWISFSCRTPWLRVDVRVEGEDE